MKEQNFEVEKPKINVNNSIHILLCFKVLWLFFRWKWVKIRNQPHKLEKFNKAQMARIQAMTEAAIFTIGQSRTFGYGTSESANCVWLRSFPARIVDFLKFLSGNY